MITKLEMCPSCVQQLKLHSLSQFNIRLYDLFLFFFPLRRIFQTADPAGKPIDGKTES